MRELMQMPAGDTPTMSSQEIAELTGKEHFHVRRDIRTMLEQLGRDASSFGGMSKDSYGRPLEVFNLPKDLTLTLVAGYSAPLRHRIVTRWLELEAVAQQPMVPQTLPEALRLAADMAEQKAQAEAALAVAAPKAEALDRISAGDQAQTITQTAKTLGVKRETLTNWLHAHGWIYRQNGTWVPYDQHIRNGRLQYKEARYTDANTGHECIKPYCHVLPKGLTYLAMVFGSGQNAA